MNLIRRVWTGSLPGFGSAMNERDLRIGKRVLRCWMNPADSNQVHETAHAASARWDYIESLSCFRILRTFPDHALAVGTIGSGWNFEASPDFGGGPEPCFMGPVRGGEKSGRGRFACEKQAAVHRSGQDRAESETSRPGVRVGSAREAVVAPGRRG